MAMIEINDNGLVYLLTQAKLSNPVNRKIFGIFTTREAAHQARKAMKSDGVLVMLTIRSINLNELFQSGVSLQGQEN